MAQIIFPKDELNASADAIAEAFIVHRQETFEVLGVQLLQFVQLAYIEKSNGTTGDDGIHWAPLKVSTILARLRRAGHITATKVNRKEETAVAPRPRQRTAYTVAKTVKRNKQLFEELEAAGVVFHDKKGKQIKTGDKHKRGTTLAVTPNTQKSTVSISPGSYQIGRDTGLQLNSASPGFMGPDGGGGNIFTQDEVSFTIGFGRNYSQYFDRWRKLIPDVLPAAWQEELERLAAERGSQLIDTALRAKKVD